MGNKSMNQEVQEAPLPDSFNDETQGSLTSSILAENLLAQLESTTLERDPNNFLKPLLERFSFLTERYEGTEKENELLMQEIKFLTEIGEKILSTKGLLKDSSVDDILDVERTLVLRDQVEALYYFFYISRFDNVVNFFVQYIFERNKELSTLAKVNVKKGDFGLQLIKKTVTSYDYAVILHCIQTVINDIDIRDFNQDEFLCYLMREEEERIHNITIKEIFELADLSPAIENYIKDFFLEENSTTSSIMSVQVRNTLFNLFKG